LIWTRANLNLGGELGDEAARVARAAAKQVITEGQNKRQKTMTGEATIRKDQIFSPEGIIEASEKQQRAFLQLVAQKDAKRSLAGENLGNLVLAALSSCAPSTRQGPCSVSAFTHRLLS
jgi:hypothetical protein